MSHTWDPDSYLAYADERGRPFVDLLARVPAENPRVVVDLGCGPGNLTALLAARWPGARVSGVDSSPEMIEAAREVDGIDWQVGDLRDWAHPDPLALRAPVDVLVSNATLQWVPEHLELLPGLLDRVAHGGWLAFQVPGNFDEPSHTTRTELAAQEPYAPHVREARVPTSHDAADYARVLLDLGCEVDAWETTYLHVLTGEDPVFAWVSGTGARPTLQALPDDLRPRFEDEFKSLLRDAYPADDAGRVILPFRRIFVVARKPATTAAGVVVSRLHHIQVACPPGGEDAARRFYADGLGMTEVDKPAELVARGGCWFRAYDDSGAVGAELHVGVEDPFAPARKAHPGFVLDSPAVLDDAASRLRELGFAVDDSQRNTFPGFVRFHTYDAHGNRVEVLAATP